MSNMKFTEEELNLIKRYSAKQPLSESLFFYTCALLAPVGFAIYGALNKDPIAILVAFIGLLVFILWFVLSSMKYEKTLNSICSKILKNQLSK